MFVPFFSKRYTSHSNIKLYPRKGGGGGKGGSGGKTGGGSKGGGSSGSGTTKSVPLSGKVPAGKGTATAYGSGGGKVITIPSGSLFAGRSAGGGSRGQVFGSRTYGSGYPGISGSGVYNRGFPFYFWPVVWGEGNGNTNTAYLHDSEYGDPSNSSRPGGPMAQANFVSNSTNTTLHLLADNSTVTSLTPILNTNCSTHLSASSSTAAFAYNPSDPNAPQPQQAVQYYRASSVVLTLDGYNDTAALSNDPNAPDTPLPTNIDSTLLDCLNQTIGLSVPLVDGAVSRWAAVPGTGAIGLFWVVWLLVGNMI